MSEKGNKQGQESKNQKERQRAKWKVFAFFLPMIIMPVIGLLGHHKVVELHEGGLDNRMGQYDDIFKSQDKQGILMDSVIASLKVLREKENMNYYQHLEAQKKVKAIIKGMKEIRVPQPDSNLAAIPTFPALYDSLHTEVELIQLTRDSIKTCEEKVKNQKFQLEECLKAQQKAGIGRNK